MKTPLLDGRWFLSGLRWTLGLIFLYAGIVKLRAPQDFADSIASFQMLPTAVINSLALSLPCFELLTAVMLLLGWHPRAAALAVWIMTTVFAAAMLTALLRGLNVDCGCFGGGTPSRLKTWISLSRDLLLIAASAILYMKTAASKFSLVLAADSTAG